MTTTTARRPLALVLATPVVATVVAVDPSGLVPSGPFRWTVTVALMGAAVCTLCVHPVRIDRVTGRLHSAHGGTWDVTDLAKVGAPAGGYVSGVTVGADHIDVTLAVAGAGGNSPTKLTTLVGTPKA